MNRFVSPTMRLMVAVFAMSAFQLGTVQAQQTGGSPAERVTVIPLQHADANEIGAQITQLLPAPREFAVTVDQRTNALIFASIDQRSLDFVRNLVELLDVPVEVGDEASAVTLVITLEHPAGGYELVELVERVFETGGPGVARVQRSRIFAAPLRVAFDASSGQIVVRGTRADVDMAAEIISALDDRSDVRGQPESSRGRTALRLVWLVRGLEGGGRALSDDLRPVADQLRPLGIDGLRQGAMLIVRLTPEEPFDAQCTANLDEPWRMEVDGRASVGDDGRHVVQLSLVAEPSSGITAPLALMTTVTAETGQLVVLGVTPIGSVDSVVVVQVVEM